MRGFIRLQDGISVHPMSRAVRLPKRINADFPSVLLILFLIIIWVAGGASRADAVGQVVVRAAAAATLFVTVLAYPQPSFMRLRPVVILLVASAILPVLQLIPLPPSWWQALPGRVIFADAARVAGEPQPWRPLSLVPGATVNALASLLVPAAALILLAGIDASRRAWLVPMLLCFVVGSTLLGLLQAGGGAFNNPLINESLGQVSGSFANRNHFALFLAMGCLICPVWAFSSSRRLGWRTVSGLGLLIVFVLTILATGSRAGLLLGGFSIVLGGLQVRGEIRHQLRRQPRWMLPVLLACGAMLIGTFVLLAIVADRATAIDRALSIDPGQDMRGRGLATVSLLISTYFPSGAGLGSFDPIFRVNEPFEVLKVTYFNHAHNDWLEIVLDAGAPGLIVLVGALGWWGWASLMAWRMPHGQERDRSRLGSSLLLLVLIASIFDYPARTPMIMTMIIIAAVWLAEGTAAVRSAGSALPDEKQLL